MSPFSTKLWEVERMTHWKNERLEINSSVAQSLAKSDISKSGLNFISPSRCKPGSDQYGTLCMA